MRVLHGMSSRSVPLARVVREHRAAVLPLAVILAINLILLGGVVLPLSRRVTTNQQRAESAERQRMVAQAEFKRAETARDSKSQATQDLDTFYARVLPADVGAARRVLQLRLQQQAREHNVQFESGGSTEEALDDSQLLRLTMQMQLSGSYDDIRAFIFNVETSPDFVVIENVRLGESEPGGPLAVSLEVTTYYRGAMAAVARAANDGR